ncbi:hypothetical protein Tco_1275149 [Tanacetum coccineum]
MWCLCDPTPSDWCKTDVHSTDSGKGCDCVYFNFPYAIKIFPPGRTTKLRNDILMFQQHHGKSLSEALTHFKDLLQKVPHHGIVLWLHVKIFYDRNNHTLNRAVDYAAGGRLRKMSAKEAWNTIEELVQYEEEEWDDPIFPEKGSLDHGHQQRTNTRKLGISSRFTNKGCNFTSGGK